MNLTQEHCTPCEDGVPPLGKEGVVKYLRELSGWELEDEARKIKKTYKRASFVEALALTNKIGELAEAEGHHPDILLSWGKVKVVLWTHKIGGLSKNDFILAAKIEEVI